MNKLLDKIYKLKSINIRDNEKALFVELCYLLKTEKKDTYIFSFDELEEYITVAKSKKLSEITDIQKRLTQNYIQYGDENDFEIISFLEKFKISKKKKEVEITINKDFKKLFLEFTYMLNTKDEFIEYFSIGGNLVKILFLVIKIFEAENITKWEVSIDDLKQITSAPQKYTASHLDNRIFNLSRIEIKSYEVISDKVYADVGWGVGRPNVIGYNIEFKKIGE